MEAKPLFYYVAGYWQSFPQMPPDKQEVYSASRKLLKDEGLGNFRLQMQTTLQAFCELRPAMPLAMIRDLVSLACADYIILLMNPKLIDNANTSTAR